MTATDPRDGSSRLEREIQEILERADAAQTPVENLQAAVRRRRASARTQEARATTLDWLRGKLSLPLVRLGVALLLAIAAATLSDFSRLLGLILAIASALVFFSLWMPARPSGIDGKPRWRGQDLDDDRPPLGFGTWRGPKRPR